MATAVVEVLMSTFNAGEFFAPLLESVLSQEDVNVRLHVRDDGSTDGTRQTVAQLARSGELAADLGTHLGPWRSYFHLLSSTIIEGAYVAFCDQDDLWLPGKLARAVSFLEGSPGRPSMYCGRLTVTDLNLKAVGLSPVPRRPLSLANALVENVALGPTIVINARGRDLVAGKLPDYAVMHDAWLYLVFSSLGQILYDIQPHLLYRVHERNHLGMQRNRLARLYKAGRYRLGGYMREHIIQAREFARLFGSELVRDDRRVLTGFCEDEGSWSSVVNYGLRPGVYRQSELDDLILRAVLVGWKTRGALAKDRPPNRHQASQVQEQRRQCP
jgi:glycosyltransferase involved in cell wall biosynthesis